MKNKGITLISLVVTIVLLLILAGITFSFLLGKNGVIAKAIDSKKAYTVGAETDAIKLSFQSYGLNISTGDFSRTSILDIENEIKNNGYECNIREDREALYAEMTKSKNIYKIVENDNGTVDVSLIEGNGNDILDYCLSCYKVIAFMKDDSVYSGNNGTDVDKISSYETFCKYDSRFNYKEPERSEDYNPIDNLNKGALAGKKIKKVVNSHCVIDQDGKVYTWGSNFFCALGNGSNDDDLRIDDPICISDSGDLLNKKIIDVYNIDCFGYIAMDENGSLYSWGSNEDGELGISSKDYTCSSPKNISISGELEGKKIKKVISYDSTVFALDDNDTLFAWGDNYGKIGNGSSDGDCISPVNVCKYGELINKKVKDIRVLNNCVFATDSDNYIYSWGGDNCGQLANGVFEDVSFPKCINNSGVLKGKTLRYIKIYGNSLYALDSENKLYTWGDNENGNLGDGTCSNSAIPICISDSGELINKQIDSLEFYDNIVFALDIDGNLYSWGKNELGLLGNPNVEIDQCCRKPHCICEGILQGKSIKQITLERYCDNDSVEVLDSEGKIYKWGNGDSNPKCITDDPSNRLYNKKIKKMDSQIDFCEYVITYFTEDGELFVQSGSFPS